MHLRHLSVHDFRSYPSAEVALAPGVTVLLGRNGQGKTNLVEAVAYLATLGSHRVAQDAPLVRRGAASAVVRAAVVRDQRELVVEIEIAPGRSNRARLNRGPVPRPRDILGAVRSVVFAPEDLTLVKGDPADRRRFMDELLVARQPRWAGVRSDYERVLKQRNALLRSAAPALGGRRRSRQTPPAGMSAAEDERSALHTLDVWDDQLVRLGAELVHGRLVTMDRLAPVVRASYDAVSASDAEVTLAVRSSLLGGDTDGETGERSGTWELGSGAVPDVSVVADAFRERLAAVRRQEVERGLTLVGPHRDDLVIRLGDLPAKGYASHGECWSCALALRLASCEVLRDELGTDPVLILDDVFAELDAGRRDRLAELVAGTEQVLITAAVLADVPTALRAARVVVIEQDAGVSRVDVPGDGPGDVPGDGRGDGRSGSAEGGGHVER